MKYLNFEEFKINEYLDPNTLHFYKYIKDSDEDSMYIDVAYNSGWQIIDYMRDKIEADELVQYFNENEIEQIENTLESEDEIEAQEVLLDLINGNHDFMVEFGKYAYRDMPEDERPSTDFFSYPEIIKKQWLIHLTDYAQDIWKEGFTHGTPDIDKLGLTTWTSHQFKKYGGYNFAYTLFDFDKYGKGGHHRHGFNYGSEAILFKSSGVRVWHNGDGEYQTVFWGENAEDIIWMEYTNEGWAIESRITGNILVVKEDIDDLIDWVEKHYDQYRKHLINKKKK